jgi:hypothetical protein
MIGLDSLAPTHAVQGTRTIVDYDFFDTLYHNPAVKFLKGRVEQVIEQRNGASARINGTSYSYDFIVMATGFDTDLSRRLASLGLNVDVSDNFFGLCVKGLPDCFFLYGPNTNTQAASVTHVMEIQSRAIMKLLQKKVAIPNEWYREFSNWIVERSPKELTACTSWYTNGSGRNLINYPGSYQEYEHRLNVYLSRLG